MKHIDWWAFRMLLRMHPYFRCRQFRHNLPCPPASCQWCNWGCPRVKV
jgi:hypothetical protein